MDIHDLAYSLGLRNVKVDPAASTPGELADQIINAVRAVPHHPTGPRLADADLCASCGNQFRPGQVCGPCGESEADAEVRAMAAIVTAMDRLDNEAVLLGEDVHERVIRWAMARWGVSG